MKFQLALKDCNEAIILVPNFMQKQLKPECQESIDGYRTMQDPTQKFYAIQLCD